MIEYRQVARTLGEIRDEVRASTLDRFRAAGGNRDRWGRRDREVMTDALCRAEDELELRLGSGATVERAHVRRMRRQMESELWP